MSKKKKTALFKMPGSQVVRQIEEPHDYDLPQTAHQSAEDHKIQKGELTAVLFLTLGIVLAFSVLYLTNRSSNWINMVSEKTAKLLIRNF